MSAVAKEVAQQDIDKWLDYKRLNDSKRDDYKDSIATLVNAVSDGRLIVDDNCNLVQTLSFPTDGEKSITKLEFKPRLKVGAVHTHLQGVKPTDADGRILAYVCALTSSPKEVIRALDTEDYSICQAIALFFL